MGTIILKCDCNHEYQDKTYGNGKRVHSISEDGKKAFCTVCTDRNATKIHMGESATKYRHIGMIHNTKTTVRKYKNI